MKIHRVTKLTGLSRFHLTLIFLVTILVAISFLDKNTINNINSVVNILELYRTRADKNTSLNAAEGNSVVKNRQDNEGITGASDSGDDRKKEEEVVRENVNFTYSSYSMNERNVSQPLPYLLIMILSGPDEKHKTRRQCVRSSYISIKQWKTNYKYFFLIGQTGNNTLERNVAMEEKRFNDIVRYPGNDTYSKLSTKVMWGFQHIAKTWDLSFSVILKTDDDSFVNVGNVMNAFQSVDLSGDFYGGGRRFPGRKPNYVKNKRTFKDLYSKDFQVPQHFCAGGGYFLTRSLLEKIISIHREPPPAQVEDIYVGSLVEKLGIEATSLNVRTNHGWQAWWNKYSKDGLVLHYLNCKKMMRLYNQVKPE